MVFSGNSEVCFYDMVVCKRQDVDVRQGIEME